MRKIEVVFVTLFALLFLSSIALAVNCPVPDTGQTKCYDDDSMITCPNSGEAFYGQDAQYTCNPQSYTKLDSNGDDLPDTSTEWVMVRDNVTGLIWENKTDDGSIHDKDKTYLWDEAQSVFIATLNSQNFGGYSDWRLPTIMELSFLVDRNSYNPSINTTYFPNTLGISSSEYVCYWSSTTHAGDPRGAWNVDFDYGYVSAYIKFYGYYVRAVRSGQCGPFDNFIDNGDGTVTNTDTGLMWQQYGTIETTTWQEALAYCENLDLAGYDDWRLPNVTELQSLVDYERYSPTINTTYFPNTQSSYYWSSTTIANDTSYAWNVDFLDGYVGNYGKSDGHYVRAVRSGQCGPFDSSTTTTIASTTTTISGSTTSTISGSTTTTVQSCPSEQIYGEYSEQTELLRYLRDNVLSATPEGQELIRLYYEWSPMIVEMMNEDEGFKKEVKEMIDGVLEVFGE